jgi:hypothetical protein
VSLVTVVKDAEHAAGAVVTTVVEGVLSALNVVDGVVKALVANGINPGGLGSLIVSQIDNVEAAQTDYDNGQGVVVGAVPIIDSKGVSTGVLVLVKQGGAAYTQLFG